MCHSLSLGVGYTWKPQFHLANPFISSFLVSLVQFKDITSLFIVEFALTHQYLSRCSFHLFSEHTLLWLPAFFLIFPCRISDPRFQDLWLALPVPSVVPYVRHSIILSWIHEWWLLILAYGSTAFTANQIHELSFPFVLLLWQFIFW